MSNLKAFFPANRGRWIKYTLTSLPVIFSALIFALNSFVDNFMATIIPGGNQALAYANTWTTIVTGIIAATTIIGSALYGQYFATNDVKKIREIIRGRIVIALGITIIFTIPALIWPEFLMQIASGFDQNVDQEIMNSGSRYLRWIAISWLFSTWGYTMAMILRESGYGNATLISSCLCLGLNIVLNIIFINLINNNNILGIPFVNINNPNEIIYENLPMLNRILGTTGYAAGNSFEEAIIQGSSEVFERLT